MAINPYTFRYPLPQRDPPLSPRETLPTMYDLPSEDLEEPGLPDEFHDLQPQLLSATLRLSNHPRDQIFTGTDLNLYYDVRHPLWHKRPDWFLVLGVPRLYDGVDLRNSYVIWQEGVNPFVVVELLSPGTEKEDLGALLNTETDLLPAESTDPADNPSSTSNGQTAREKPPGKWVVYEQILRVPYYIVFSRYTNQVRFFRLVGAKYEEQAIDPDNPRIWIPEIERGLGFWNGEYDSISRIWLRWYDSQGHWMLTEAEQERLEKEQERQRAEQERLEKEQEQLEKEQERQRAEQERQRAEQERQRAEQERQRAEQAEQRLRQVAINLLAQGMAIAQVATLTGLSPETVERLAENCNEI